MHCAKPRRCLIVLLVVCAVTTGGLLAAEQLAEKVTVFVTEVPVNVTRNGEPVLGLTADNFELFSNGKLQRISGFDVRDLTALVPHQQQTAVPISARRHILFLFDFSFSQPGSLLRARKAALEVAADDLHPSDLVAVATYSLGQGANLVLNFTSDRSQLDAAIQSLAVSRTSRLAADPLALTVIEPDAMTSDMGFSSGDSDPAQEQLRIMQAQANRADRRSRQLQISDFARDLGALAQLLDSVQGRKDILFLSEGFDNSLVFASEDPGKIREMNQARESGQLWGVDPGERFGDATQQAAINEMLQAFRRTDCVIHSIDIGSTGVGSTTGGDDAGRTRAKMRSGGNQALSVMASETGGSYTRNTNELGPAMDQIMETTSVTYVLAFQPEVEPDGKYHRLRIKLKDVPGGAKLTHRPGYFAPTPYAERSPDERQLQIAGQLLASQEGGAIPTSVLAVPFRHGDEEAFVPVLIEIEGDGLIEGHVGDGLAVQIFGYALDGDGRIHDVFSHTVAIDLQQAREALRANGLKFYGTFRLEPGAYSVRILVVNGQTGLSHLRIVELEVPDLSTESPSLLPPMFPDPYGKWLLAKKEPGGPDAPPFPFVVQDQPYLPAALPAVQSDERPRLYLLVRNLGEQLQAAGRILDKEGSSLREVELAPLESAATAMPGYQALVTSVGAKGLAPGTYELSVTVSDKVSGRSATSAIPFVVR